MEGNNTAISQLCSPCFRSALDLVFVPRGHIDLYSVIFKIYLEGAAVDIRVSNQVNNRKGATPFFQLDLSRISDGQY